MVDNKSLSADSELNSALDYIRNGEYKQCRKTIEKKLQKLKNPIDITNFKIVKVLLLSKQHKHKEASLLVKEIRDSIFKEKTLSDNDALKSFFGRICREVRHEKTGGEVFKKFNLQGSELALMNEDQRERIFKELIYNNDTAEAYQVLTKSFIPNEKDKEKQRFLVLLKYEFVYNMVFKYGLLKEQIGGLTLKEMIKAYCTDEFKKEKGFVDLLIKYYISFGKIEELKEFTKGDLGFTNAPVKDLLLDIYLNEGDKRMVLLIIIKEIEGNLTKFNHLYFERLVNCIIWFYNDKDVKLLSSCLKDVFEKRNTNKLIPLAETFEDSLQWWAKFISASCGYMLELIDTYFNDSAMFNTIKSALLAVLMLCYFTEEKNSLKYFFSKEVTGLLIKFIPKLVNKQSVLQELKPYFKLLEPSDAISLFDASLFNSSGSSSTSTAIEVLYFKLQTLLNPSFTANKPIDVIEEVLKRQTQYSPTLSKGERLPSDDLVILINELNAPSQLPSESSISLDFSLLALNYWASKSSPYNYDITLKLIATLNNLGLYSKSLEMMKYMNFKGPQYETCCYISFKSYYEANFKQGMLYLINNFNKWEGENLLGLRKTTWKMMKGRNFYTSSQLINFDQETYLSYYRNLIQLLEVMMIIDEKVFEGNQGNHGTGEDDREVEDRLDELAKHYEILVNEEKLIRNQDLMITAPKYFKHENQTNSSIKMQSTTMHKIPETQFKIDSLNKTSSLYFYTPGFKNNYIEAFDTGIYSIFNNQYYILVKYYEFKVLEFFEGGLKFDAEVEEGIYNNYIKYLAKVCDTENVIHKYTLFNATVIKVFKVLLTTELYKTNFSDSIMQIEVLIDNYSKLTTEITLLKTQLAYVTSLNVLLSHGFKVLFICMRKLSSLALTAKKDFPELYQSVKILTTNYKQPLLFVFKNFNDLTPNFNNDIESFDLPEVLKGYIQSDKTLIHSIKEERRSQIKETTDKIKYFKALIIETIN